MKRFCLFGPHTQQLKIPVSCVYLGPGYAITCAAAPSKGNFWGIAFYLDPDVMSFNHCLAPIRCISLINGRDASAVAIIAFDKVFILFHGFRLTLMHFKMVC